MLLLLQNLLPTALTGSLGLFTFWARRGLNDPGEDLAILLAMGVALGICHVPEALPRRLPWNRVVSPFVSLALLFLPALLSHLGASRVAFACAMLLGGVGVGAALWFLWRSRFVAEARIPVLLSVLALCAGMPGLAWKEESATALFPEGLGAGFFYLDTLFHAAVSNFLQLHGIATTGLDGLTPFSYHFGSHWLLGGYSEALGVSGLFTYKVVYPILLLPLYFKVFLSFCRALAVESTAQDSRRAYTAGLLLVLGHLGFLPPLVQEANLSSFHVISESYLVSLVLTFHWLWALCEVSRAWRSDSRPGRLLTVGLAMAATCVLISWTKLSQGYLLGVGVSVLMLLGARRLGKLWLSLGAVCLLALVLGASFASSPHWQQKIPFSAFHFLRHVDPVWVPFFFFTYFSWHWVYLGVRLASLSRLPFRGWRAILLAPENADLLCFLGVTLAAIAPAFVLGGNMGSSGAYFLEPPRLLALALAIVFLPACEAALPRSGPHRLLLQGALALGWAFTIVLSAQWLRTAYQSNKVVENELLSRSTISSTAPRAERIRQQQSEAPWLSALRELARLPADTKRSTVLYIPRSATSYWENLGTDFYGAVSSALLAPAMTAMPLLDGLPRVGHHYHGFAEMMASPSFRSERNDRTSDELCQAAFRLGFRRVIRLDPSEDGVRQTEVVCPKSK